jgi:hypothetical protein
MRSELDLKTKEIEMVRNFIDFFTIILIYNDFCIFELTEENNKSIQADKNRHSQEVVERIQQVSVIQHFIYFK